MSLRSRPSSPSAGRGWPCRRPTSTLYRTCPLKYKFARVFGIPQEQTINQRFGIVIHQVLERYHSQQGERRGAGQPQQADGAVLGGLAALGLRRVRRRAAVPRAGDRGPPPLPRARVPAGLSPAGSSASSTSRSAPPPARPRRPRRRAARRPLRADRLQDRRSAPQRELESDIQLAIYRLAAREAWRIEAAPRQLLVRARRREGRRRRLQRRPRARRVQRCWRSARASSARTSSPARRRRSAPGVTSG